MWQFFSAVRQSVHRLLERRQLESDIREIETLIAEIQNTLKQWRWKKNCLEKQLYALQTDDIRGIVEQYYVSREDYQARVDFTREELTYFTNKLLELASEKENMIERLDQRLQEKRELLLQYVNPVAVEAPSPSL